jgi:hypothetical protein
MDRVGWVDTAAGDHILSTRGSADLDDGDRHDVVRRTGNGWRYASRTYVPQCPVDVVPGGQVTG